MKEIARLDIKCVLVACARYEACMMHPPLGNESQLFRPSLSTQIDDQDFLMVVCRNFEERRKDEDAATHIG